MLGVGRHTWFRVTPLAFGLLPPTRGEQLAVSVRAVYDHGARPKEPPLSNPYGAVKSIGLNANQSATGDDPA